MKGIGHARKEGKRTKPDRKERRTGKRKAKG